MASVMCTEPIDPAFEEQVLRKAFKRIVFFLFLLNIFNYLDRINVGFAALAMNRDLKLTATTFGLSITMFYIGYAFCEIPSNILLTKYGARRWIARILITWGLASTATMFAVGAHSLYIIRAIVGVAEAGYQPGILLYLSYWFPATYRARATALFLIAQPLTAAIGSQASGLILDHAHGILGLPGWRWLFLFEGFPTVVLGIIALFYLCDGPAKAKWLTDPEKGALQRRLQREQSAVTAHAGGGKVWRELFSRNVILLAIIYFCMVMGLNATANWTPQIVRDVLRAHSFSYVGLVAAIPATCSIIVIPFWCAHSDRKMERTWHYMLPILLSAVGWIMVAYLKMPEVRMIGLIFCAVGVFVGQSIFWTVPVFVLSPKARPVGIAAISTFGMFGAMSSPLIIGYLKDLTGNWTASLTCIAVVLVGAAVLIHLIPRESAAIGVKEAGAPR
ncbi:MAG: MFS transporter [Candidatus Korobacteraceae bacterium]